MEDDVLNVHCINTQINVLYQRIAALTNNHNHVQENIYKHVESGVLLTKALFSQVHIDDKEHESSGAFFLPSNKSVHPA